MDFRRCLVTGAGVLLALSVSVPAKATVPVASDAACASEAASAERSYGIPTALLHAISIVESGRYDPDHRAVIAWPWTVMAEGQGRYFPTKAEAIAEVRRLKGRGVQNIDVGCMQVNLRYHPQAFNNLDEAFDPAVNVGYAARFLKGLFEATGHWPTAASYYHSQTPSLAAVYREKLMKVWANGDTTQYAAAGPRQSRKTASLAHAPHKPVPHAPALTAIPGEPDVEARRREWREQAAIARGEAARIADAYRQARVAEYQLRRAHFQEVRAALSAATRAR